MNKGQLLLLWPGEVRRKREGDFGQIGQGIFLGLLDFSSGWAIHT